MTLSDFLIETQAEVRAQMSDGSLYAELVFAEMVMQHLADVGMTFEPVVCHYQAEVGRGRAKLRITGYAVSEETYQLDLFVSLYDGAEALLPIPDSETTAAVEQCLRFLTLCASGKMAEVWNSAP